MGQTRSYPSRAIVKAAVPQDSKCHDLVGGARSKCAPSEETHQIHTNIQNQKRRWDSRSQAPPFVPTSDWGDTKAGKPNKKQDIPQKQQQEMSAALDCTGMQAAETKTPMSASARIMRARTHSSKTAEKDIDGTTSTCMHRDAMENARIATQKTAVQIFARKIGGMIFDREKVRTSATAHRNCAVAATRSDKTMTNSKMRHGCGLR
jgi:hypothetical protein